MLRNTFSLSSLLLALAVTPLYSAEPISLSDTTLPEIQKDFEIVIPAQKAKIRNPMTINSLKYIKDNKDDVNNKVHIRMQQEYLGFPVYGGYGIVHSNSNALMNAQSSNMTGVVYEGLEAELGRPPADFTQNSSMALAYFKASYSKEAIHKEEVTPIVFVDENSQAHWAYKVTLMIVSQESIPEKPSAIIDAKTLTPLVQWNDIKTMTTLVNGEGYGGNERTRKIHYGKNAPFLQISRDSDTALCYMENPVVKVVDMGHEVERPNNPMQFSCASSFFSRSFWTGYSANGYDIENGAYSPTNDALYAGQVINKMYFDWFKVYPLYQGKEPMKLIMRVHYGSGFENAFWDGEQMTFGDGDILMHPLVSVGVGAHEISHGFTEQHSNLQYYGQSGAINESFSDMAAQAAEYFIDNKNSWTIGKELFKAASGQKAMRFMDRPSRDGNSIDRADQYYPELNVHHASGVYNRLFYLLAHKPNWNTKKAFSVMVQANMYYWTPYSNYIQGACGILQAAKDLGLPVEGIKESLQEVAINYESACATG